jgi:UDP-N-acetylglucosamine 2-epimerase
MIFHVVGARPQFIKLSPVLKAFKQEGLISKTIHTGQHYDFTMNELLFNNLGLPEPDFHLGIGSGSHAIQTAGMLRGIEDILIREKPELVIVYGDTNSTLAGALASAKINIKVAHVEAGLRSFDKRMPEEINRIIADRLSDYHFCPTLNAVRLLAAEGMKGIFTGDVMVDALLDYSKKLSPPRYTKPYILVTIHRAENTDDPVRFKAVWQAMKSLAKTADMIFPVHPRTKNLFGSMLKDAGKISVIEPVEYTTMLSLTKYADCVLTDSGGLVKEAFLLKTPCVTVRTTTEWPETIEAGANILSDAEPEAICEAVSKIRSVSVDPAVMPFGDGTAANRIASFIKKVAANK